MREQTKKLVEHYQIKCLQSRLDLKEVERWGYCISRYTLCWQTTIALALHNALALKQFDIGLPIIEHFTGHIMPFGGIVGVVLLAFVTGWLFVTIVRKKTVTE